MEKLKCTNVSRRAWNDEKVTLENEDATIIIHFKNPALHGTFVEGETYENIAGETIEESEPSSKKAVSKKPASKKKK
jgi:hypothetical protein